VIDQKTEEEEEEASEQSRAERLPRIAHGRLSERIKAIDSARGKKTGLTNREM
jgi:hypothetical protein